MRTARIAFKLVARHGHKGAIQEAGRLWREQLNLNKELSLILSESWWILVESADGKTLAELFSTDTLAQIAVAKSMKETQNA